MTDPLIARTTSMKLALTLAKDKAELMREYFYDRLDVKDGPEGPVPSAEMSHYQNADTIIETLDRCIAALGEDK